MKEGQQHGPGNPRPMSQVKIELIWEGKYDEYGNRRKWTWPGASCRSSRKCLFFVQGKSLPISSLCERK